MKKIRIGTRDSELALWQAHQVQNQLENLGYKTVIVPLKAKGDIVLDKPLYEFGITGIFTRHLDVAMLKGEIDIAVHSMKDVPTVLPKNIVQAAVLKRASHQDILVFKENCDFLTQDSAILATSSLRRKAQWLNRYPQHQIVDLRGNVQTRLKKLAENNWNGAIFAAAGLERVGLRPAHSLDLDWMIPAPAQGIIMITANEKDDFSLQACAKINHSQTALCAKIERDFLHILEGGCTAPIGALASIDEQNQKIHFKGILLSEDGQQKIEVTKECELNNYHNLAKECADYIITQGGKKLLKAKEQVAKINVLSTKKLTQQQ
nr:hydroxymethylbilane synthase [Pasteurella sp.]